MISRSELRRITNQHGRTAPDLGSTGPVMDTTRMTFKEYQDCIDQRHHQTSVPPEFHLLYLSNALCGEAGELANFVKKQYRDQLTHVEDIALEIGDTLNYLTALASSMGLDLATIADTNLKKTAWRMKNFDNPPPVVVGRTGKVV